jgi:hypothetical protein
MFAETESRENEIETQNASECLVVKTIEQIGTPWRRNVIYALTEGDKRFNELKRATGVRSITITPFRRATTRSRSRRSESGPDECSLVLASNQSPRHETELFVHSFEMVRQFRRVLHIDVFVDLREGEFSSPCPDPFEFVLRNGDGTRNINPCVVSEKAKNIRRRTVLRRCLSYLLPVLRRC